MAPLTDFKIIVDGWLASLNTEEKLRLSFYRLSGLRHLRQVRICFDFLKSALRFWDPQYHVFRFVDHEMCPTAEEFAAILGPFETPTSNS